MDGEEKKAPTTIELIEQVKGTEEFQTLLTNEVQSKFDERIGAKVKSIYDPFDAMIEQNLGLKKPDDVKTADWNEKHLKELVADRKELAALKLKGEGNTELEKLNSDKVNKLKAIIADKDLLLLKVTTEGFQGAVSSEVDHYLVGKTFMPTFSEPVIDTLVRATKAEIVNNTKKLENGKVAVINPKTGNYYTDALGEPLSPAQVADKLFAPMFHTAKKGGGANDEQTAAITQGDVVAIDMDAIKSKADFYKAFKSIMAPKGLTSLDEKYQLIQRATMKHYDIEKLSLS